MNIDQETIRKIAHLARLEFSEAEATAIGNDFNKIL